MFGGRIEGSEKKNNPSINRTLLEIERHKKGVLVIIKDNKKTSENIKKNIIQQQEFREYGVGAQILRDLNVTKIKLLTNNPKKRAGLVGYGLEIVENVPIKTKPNKHNKNYMLTKKNKMGHDF